MLKRFPLYQKLSLLMALVALVATLAYAALASWSSDRYHQEATQKLHEGLAHYVLDHQPAPLMTESSINKTGLKALAMNTMMINPLVEVYLLDAEGHIIGHALPEADVISGTVNLAPVHRFIETTRNAARSVVYGDNPRQPAQPAVFSAAPIIEQGNTIGYLYVVLASHEAASIIDQLQESHILRMTLGGAVALSIFLLLCAIVSFRLISNPVKKLNREVRHYRQHQLTAQHPQAEPSALPAGDEVEELRTSVTLMQQRIQEQFDQLAAADNLRRELISNVSHDLRTPLAAMQGYLETLLLKQDQLEASDRQHYTHIAFRHSQHMGKLVSQLFELSKLDAGKVEPKPEVFSLKELVYDLIQDYELPASQQAVRLSVDAPDADVLVQADIELMQRVLQNLVDNALRHTPKQGHIEIALIEKAHRIHVSVTDSGAGIAPEDMPYVFDRYFQAGQPAQRSETADAKVASGSGLGLSIVKRILELHHATIEVSSPPEKGAQFSFVLPMATG